MRKHFIGVWNGSPKMRSVGENPNGLQLYFHGFNARNRNGHSNTGNKKPKTSRIEHVDEFDTKKYERQKLNAAGSKLNTLPNCKC